MPGRIKEEVWDLSSIDVIAIPASSPTAVDGVANIWSDIWKYQVPTGEAHILKPSHHFSIYLETDGGTGNTPQADGTTRVKIEVRDQSEQDAKTIFGPTLYVACQDFDDVTKMATLDLQNDLAIEEKFWIVIMVYATAITEFPYSYFNLETIRVRSSI